MQKEIQKLIDKVKKCARDVYNELGEGWPECVYQKAMEVVLRENKQLNANKAMQRTAKEKLIEQSKKLPNFE